MANPSRLDKIQITGNANSATATKVNVQEANGEVNTQTINTGFNKNFGLNSGDVVGANTLLNQYSTTPVDWTATVFNSGQVVFYGGKQWLAKIATVAGDVPAVSSKWEEITFEALANKTVIVDQTIIDGSTNAVSGNAVFEGLAGKQNEISGAANYLTKFGIVGVVQSQIFDNGTNVGIGVNSSVARFHVGNRNVTRSSNSRILVSENFDNTATGNGHAFSDSSLITQSPFTAYASYDARIELNSSSITADHYVSYQAAPKLNFTGSLSSLWGIYTTAEINSGTIANNYGLYVANPVKTGGTLNNNTGLYIENQTSGAQNYSIFSEGGKNALLGILSVGDTNPTGGGVFSVFSNSGDHIRIKRASQTDRAIVISGSDLLSIGTWANPSQFTLDVNGNAQFVGTISASPATTENQVPTWGQVKDAALPYKLYTFYVNQSVTNIPTSVKLSNNTTLSSTPTWERTGVGDYRFFIGTVNTTKVFPYAVQSSWTFGNDIYAASVQGQYIQITRRTNGVLTDGLSNILFEIRQYP